MLKMQHNRHLILHGSGNADAEIQIFDYGDSVTIWAGTSPEVYKAKDGESMKTPIDAFVSSLLNNGYSIASETPISA